jgi:hypothetical protein
MRSVRVLGLLLAASAPVLAQSFNFLPGTPYPAGNGPSAVASSDFNGDGIPDLVVANTAAGSVSVYFGKGGGNFTGAFTYSLPGCLVEFVAAGDFNRDGIPDVLAVCALQNTIWVLPGLGFGGSESPFRPLSQTSLSREIWMWRVS